MSESDEQPRGTLTTRTMTMPADTNPAGDIFGGWVLSQMDIAGAICAGERAQRRVVRALGERPAVLVGQRPFGDFVA